MSKEILMVVDAISNEKGVPCDVIFAQIFVSNVGIDIYKQMGLGCGTRRHSFGASRTGTKRL